MLLFCYLKGGVVAALAADWITARKTLWGGCAGSQLDHGFMDGRECRVGLLCPLEVKVAVHDMFFVGTVGSLQDQDEK